VIKLTITSFPEKDLDVEAVAVDHGFEVEVVRQLGFGFRVREQHPLEGTYDREAFIDLLMDAQNGEASELLEAFGLDTRPAWARHQEARW
jgi:hypothetical protein